MRLLRLHLLLGLVLSLFVASVSPAPYCPQSNQDRRLRNISQSALLFSAWRDFT